jgi:hypothetical protein
MNKCFECQHATYRGLSYAGFNYLVKERRIKCAAYPNAEEREIYAKNPNLTDAACRHFEASPPEALKERLEALKKYGITLTA